MRVEEDGRNIQKFLVVNTKATIAKTSATALMAHKVNFLVLVSVIEGYRIVPASRPIANPLMSAWFGLTRNWFDLLLDVLDRQRHLV